MDQHQGSPAPARRRISIGDTPGTGLTRSQLMAAPPEVQAAELAKFKTAALALSDGLLQIARHNDAGRAAHRERCTAGGARESHGNRRGHRRGRTTRAGPDDEPPALPRAPKYLGRPQPLPRRRLNYRTMEWRRG